ncbi:indolepyruvate ferredoxin oxidoreductase family protein [Nocardia sp. CDC153]|uniref:indolepyruvate ferredoxin oxidoreductase family protein n=1 Tax=Nocardia sp. CDC153 TaxID=3112167 RepID=UPI002DBADFBA|nr:indolepyruvate ferredoxin oxidoreductase family protein [Nocardia sp. CDC153]MEC3952036.1 indolepyruvate ferredoxin oxidoreductase family protein [Nocardia sp. CDC153]
MTDTTASEALPTHPYDLADRYRPGAGPVLLTGVQAIARLLVEQQACDARNGRRVATFVSGYQGSPLAGVDTLLAGMPNVLAEHHITFSPGLNEELAATAVWGSQANLGAGEPTYDGVVGVWYGKGPGLDRATDVLRHANHYGVNARGGMVLLVGDDPGSKSSSLPLASERSLAAMNIPVLFPRNSAEIVTLGLHAVALSRASGCVVALKVVSDVADGSWIVDGSVTRCEPVVPRINWGTETFEYRQRPMAAPIDSLVSEVDLLGPRRAVIDEYAVANRLDAVELNPPQARIGIVAAGPVFDTVRQSLLDLGLDEEGLRRAGVRLLRIAMLYPVSAHTVRRFALGLDRVLVVEEKTGFVESQLREILYGAADAPGIVGKRDRDGEPLVPADGELTAGRLRGPLYRVLHRYAPVKRPLPEPLPLEPLAVRRTAFFCSGCPHNRSTRVPEESIAGGGIGCHTLVTMSGRPDSAVTGLTQMGGEGAQWIGQAPFTDIGHIFQNVGDGTFFHSGQLAVQACIAAGVNITYKLLFNEVVAMTGAQRAEGGLTVSALTRKLAAEGVAKIIVCAEDPGRHRFSELAAGTELWHRDRLDEAQRELRAIAGVTVLIYDQHCAADARRRRKRGLLPDKPTRIVINEAVCEGCGDCGQKSNCLSVREVDTDLGFKTRIDQSSCNLDYSCLDGDCPSFVTVEIPPARKSVARRRLEPPRLVDRAVSGPIGSWNVLLAGIGGTGIVTVNQVLATAAAMAGLEVTGLDQTGLSQKAGPVVSHLRYGTDPVPDNRLTVGGADCVLAFDLLTATDTRNLNYCSAMATVAVASTSRTPTGDMVYDKEIRYPGEESLLARLRSVTHRVESFDALAAAQSLFGETTHANFLLVGMAYELGALHIPAASIEAAITLNRVSVADNIAAFRWGRAAVAEPSAFADAAQPSATPPPEPPTDLFGDSTLTGAVRQATELAARRLISFQNRKLARRYVGLMDNVWRAERAATDRTEFSVAAARGLYRFMAYKDEYEVARLLTDPEFLAHIDDQVPGARARTYRLHPPILRTLGMRSKIGLGPRTRWVLPLLAKGKVLRGTALDPFGHTGIRRLERALRDHYIALIGQLTDELATDYDRAVAAAEAADLVRGYETVKLESVQRYRTRLAHLGLDLPAAVTDAGSRTGD